MKQNDGRKPRRRDTRDGPFKAQFKEYAKVLDEKNEKRERIVKASRDVTQKSKKLIFALHRITNGNREETLSQASTTAQAIREQIASTIAKELDDKSYYSFHRAFSPGLQEYIEARTFLAYLHDLALISREQLEQELISDCETKQVYPLPVDPSDYVLGVADLTGELMRRAVATGSEAAPICEFLRGIETAMEALSKTRRINGRDIPGKIAVLKQSVGKVEKSCFNRAIREAEMQKVQIRNGS